jgi:hypothetical protein
MELSPGTKPGPYEVIGPLGTGGRGKVYRARDTRLERTVAIKPKKRANAETQGAGESAHVFGAGGRTLAGNS